MQRPLLLVAGFWAQAMAMPAAKGPTAALCPEQTVVGTATALPSATVNKFLGVPFAQSPPERFSPPTDPTWIGTRQATRPAPACMQQWNYPRPEQQFEIRVFDNPTGPPPPEDEDCLYLNVYAPAGSPPPNGWPVMFWLYGGNLQSGDASLPWYDGSHMAASQGVVVVSPNYRTNVFGFPNIPGVPAGEQNLGFLDQRKALNWVTENIKAFNGDPTKLTIFGQSAGGYSVLQLVANPPKPLPFHAAIVESYGDDRGKGGPDSWPKLLNATGCASSSASSALDCMRKQNATHIQNIIETQGIVFPPVYDNITCVEKLGATFEAKKAADVPIMIGSNANEMSVFLTGTGETPPGNLTDVEEAIALTGIPKNQSKAALDLYPKYYSPFQLATQITTDAMFTCKTALLSGFAAASGNPVWRYWYNGSFPNEQLFADAGAWHTSEIPIVFGTYYQNNATDGQNRLSAIMQKAWTQFAKDPVAGPGWVRVGSGNGTWVQDFASSGIARTVSNTTTDFLCPLLLENGLGSSV